MKRLLILGLFTSLAGLSAAAQSGGQFAITQSVTGGGGASPSGAPFGINATIAQPNAGGNATGAGFGLSNGFWHVTLAPTAAMVSIRGRVTLPDGRGLRNARLILTNQSGATQSALTSPFGHFEFTEVESGETYVLTVQSKRYQFSNGTQILLVNDSITDILFTADWE